MALLMLVEVVLVGDVGLVLGVVDNCCWCYWWVLLMGVVLLLVGVVVLVVGVVVLAVGVVGG